jgi:hypothetical protein
MAELAYNPRLRHMVGPPGTMRPHCGDTSSAFVRLVNELARVTCPRCLELLGYPSAAGLLPNEGDSIEVGMGPVSE